MSESRLDGVEIFQSGTFRGKTYTPKDLDSIVHNFNRNSTGSKPRLRVPFVIGHEEDQELLRNSGLAAAGWVDRIYTKLDGPRRLGTSRLRDFASLCAAEDADPQSHNEVTAAALHDFREEYGLKPDDRARYVLCADIVDVPAEVRRLLHGKAIRKISAEIYDEIPGGLKGSGKALRRVAGLGGDVPQVKGLEDIPVPETHSERFADAYSSRVSFHSIKPMPDGCYAVFGEVRSMAVDKFEQAVGQKAMWAKADATGSISKKTGRYDADKFRKRSGTMRDHGNKYFAEGDMEQLKEILQGLGIDPASLTDEVLSQIVEAAGAGHSEPDTDDKGGLSDNDTDDFADEELPEPQDDDERERFSANARKYADRALKHFNKYCSQKMSDYLAQLGKDGTNEGDGDKDEDKPMKMSEVEALVERAVTKALGDQQAAANEIKKFTEGAAADAKKLQIENFCETRLKAGKILPVELDQKNPANLKRRLYRADSRTVVEKFTEKGKSIQLTELDLQMREIDARSARHFAEMVKAPTKQGDADDAELEKVERFSEDYRFGRALEAAGKTPAEYVERFKEARKARPGLTAVEYGVPDSH